MNRNLLVWFALILLIAAGFIGKKMSITEDEILSYTIDPKSSNLKLYWKDDQGKILRSIQNLKTYLENKDLHLLFALNGGMYKEDNSPLGLFIQDQKKLSSINTYEGNGNFYLKPNGVFYITTDKKAEVCKTIDFVDSEKIQYATQSGPMLLIDGEIHPVFKKGSSNLNIRNGVGILPDGKIVFAISKKEINFYDFASYFKNLGCKNALYLDGFVSRMYLPEKKWKQTDGNFGVIIGVTDK
jgi:uncharacterized protein YigE (DUF2233 family)